MTTGTIILIVYIIGYICSYYSIRWHNGGHETWSEVWSTMRWSILSWLTVILALYMSIEDKYGDSEPPKWL